MQTRPTPPGGFTDAGNDFSYLRTIEGHRTYKHEEDPMQCSEYQNAADFDDMFNMDDDNDEANEEYD